MCRQSESIEERRKAVDELGEACRACLRSARSFRERLNETLLEKVPDDLTALLKKLK